MDTQRKRVLEDFENLALDRRYGLEPDIPIWNVHIMLRNNSQSFHNYVLLPKSEGSLKLL